MRNRSLLFVALSISCTGQPNQIEQQPKKDSMHVNSNEVDNRDAILDNTIGVLVTSESYQFGDTIHVFDKNRNLFTQLVKTDEAQVIALYCIAKDKHFYQVKLENNETGFIPCDSPKLKLQTWEEHILSVFSVSFDEQKNPLLKSPSMNAEQLFYDKDEFYHPSQIKDEWLQVKWGSDGKWNYGWIRWKDKGKLLVELFTFA